jgi:uncharacterized SAM-binding protein YcdF (DUF218 family)
MRFLFKLFMLVLFIFLLSVAAIIFDGLNDQGSRADVALVTTGDTNDKDGTNPVLDRVVAMHRSGEISSVIVIGSTWHDAEHEDAAIMANYLGMHGIPGGNIIQSNHGGTTQETARLAAEMIKAHGFTSVMIVADYYDVTRLRLALEHEGIRDVQKVHVGSVRKEDTVKIANSVVALYSYVGHVYLLPEAQQVKKEAQVGMDKASVDAEKAKDKVNKDLDSLAK